MTAGTRVAVVVGNPKPQSRTRAAATYLARELTGREADHVVDSAYDDPAAYAHWLGLARPVITALLESRALDRTGARA